MLAQVYMPGINRYAISVVKTNRCPLPNCVLVRYIPRVAYIRVCILHALIRQICKHQYTPGRVSIESDRTSAVVPPLPLPIVVVVVVVGTSTVSWSGGRKDCTDSTSALLLQSTE